MHSPIETQNIHRIEPRVREQTNRLRGKRALRDERGLAARKEKGQEQNLNQSVKNQCDKNIKAAL